MDKTLIAQLEDLKRGILNTPETRSGLIRPVLDAATLDRAIQALTQDRAAVLEEALREFVYETTHLSSEGDDGSHKCRISARTLAKGRAALKTTPATQTEYKLYKRAGYEPINDTRNPAVADRRMSADGNLLKAIELHGKVMRTDLTICNGRREGDRARWVVEKCGACNGTGRTPYDDMAATDDDCPACTDVLFTPQPAAEVSFVELWCRKIGIQGIDNVALDDWAISTSSREVRGAFVWLLRELDKPRRGS